MPPRRSPSTTTTTRWGLLVCAPRVVDLEFTRTHSPQPLAWHGPDCSLGYVVGPCDGEDDDYDDDDDEEDDDEYDDDDDDDDDDEITSADNDEEPEGQATWVFPDYPDDPFSDVASSDTNGMAPLN